MPLVTDENTAARILIGVRDKYPNVALQNFARTVLGAHSDQAARLAQMAERDEVPPPAPQPEEVQVTREVDGRELSITLKAGKLPITSYEELVSFYEIDTDRWQPTQQLFNFWGSESSPNFQVKATFREVEYRGIQDQDRQQVRDWFAELAPKWEPIYHADIGDHNLLEIVVSDLHADKLTLSGTSLEDHLNAVGRGIDNIVARADETFPISRVALVFLGDTFDHEGDGATSNGTAQQVQGDPRRSYLQVRDFIGGLTRTLAHLGHVDLYVLSGNHDRERAFYAVDSLAGLFRDHPNVTVHVNTDRAHFEWGRALVGLWHGDRQRNEDIAMTLMREFPVHGKDILEVHLGHTHTRREDEVHGVLLRRFRTPTPDNRWARENLFNHNQKTITGIVWNKDRGEVATFPYHLAGDAWTS